MKRFILTVAGGLLLNTSLFAQHDMQHMNMTMGHDDTTMHTHMHMSSMSHAYSLNLPMNRDGSGTSWLPDASPMYGYMVHTKKWMYMFHGNLFIRYNKQGITDKGSRGNEKWDAPNYIMAMGQTKVGQKGLFHFNVMLSADALIQGKGGYPLLFQTGETWNNHPLVDRQHPHDLFAELSAAYSYAISKKADVYAYFGYPGEPALGSVAFMHRPSAMFDPDAPISHHWDDGTHITFGVATVGLRYGKFKLEGSSFTGREPDENRYNFDQPRFDSWSTRLSFNPSRYWALQVSHGYVKSPEVLHPDEDVNRTTASATFSYPLRHDQLFDATALWGQNNIAGEENSNAFLLEANLKLNKLVLYTRYEWVQKSAEELALDPVDYGIHTLYPVNAITLGAGYDLLNVGPITIAAGGQLSLYHADQKLDPLYGNNPLAGEVYLHFYPKRMN